MPSLVTPKALTITNPLIQYRSLIALQKLDNDPAQHRLALKLQDLYRELKDYEPELEYSDRLEKISRAIDPKPDSHGGHPRSRARLSSLFSRQSDTASKSLVRYMTSRESALNIQSPKGLLIHGEVGRGKTMLLNLLADALPTGKKRRFHFNIFMLEIYRRLEQVRKDRLSSSSDSSDMAYEHSILSLARDLIFNSPIVFLDEFQLPDRAASKLLSSLFVNFFHLGGVLVATSNRLPEELAKASGIEFVAPSGRTRGRILPGSLDFADFLEVLKARCDVWEMEGERDWRRESANARSPTPGSLHDTMDASESQDKEPLGEDSTVITGLPPHYHLISSETGNRDLTLATSFGRTLSLSQFSWESAAIRVYGRDIPVPRHRSGIMMWSFPELCATYLGPADYITLASRFHTALIVDVPILTTTMRNEARRFITLLDALYEAGCKLVIQAAAPPDDLFFPEPRPKPGSKPGSRIRGLDENSVDEGDDDSVYQEMYSDVYQDSTAPFRPNVSSYEQDTPHHSSSRPRSILADEDADFGPVYGNGRGRGIDSRGVDEMHTRTHHTDAPPDGPRSNTNAPDFTQAHTALVGEDERFAYKRARSRLWEMCGQRWWSREGDFHNPIDPRNRHWEGPQEPEPEPEPEQEEVSTHRRRGSQTSESLPVPSGPESQNGPLFRHGGSPFRVMSDPPPRFSVAHFWRMMTWGKRAGAWGRGELRSAPSASDADHSDSGPSSSSSSGPSSSSSGSVSDSSGSHIPRRRRLGESREKS